ncbi:hypothetical protein EW145_g1759 [Phellinidium pouzarii]|uniref:Uncharacterized protein n=1 Tax=Phellinidium pouzarii TaxID=167371 RepID=A0A4S4LF11_9AGAM|nr:hypothetical protein EW145_g1759 [Phellinidium pouzarii]
MATNYTDIKADVPITTLGSLKAKPGKGDDVAQRLSNLKARADSDVEPGTLSFFIVRYIDTFAFYEE